MQSHAQQRRRIYDEVRSSLIVLGKIDDDSAINAINQTRARWDRIDNPLNRQIVKQCDEALRLIRERNPKAEK